MPHEETFFTAVGCMDGRIQEFIVRFGQQKFGALYPDSITEAGLVGILAKEPVDLVLQKSLKFKIVDVSLRTHESRGIIIHGHAECAGNPVDDKTQRDDVRKAMQFITQLVGSAVPVVGAFVHRSEEDPQTWEVEEITATLMA